MYQWSRLLVGNIKTCSEQMRLDNVQAHQRRGQWDIAIVEKGQQREIVVIIINGVGAGAGE